MRAGQQCAPSETKREATPRPGIQTDREATLNVCGVGVAMLQGKSWALLLEPGDFLPGDMDNWRPVAVFVDGKYVSPDTWYGAAGKPFQRHLFDKNFCITMNIPTAGVAGQAGTCRFGTEPTPSALDVNSKAREPDNLYVVDTSFFPSIGAVDPALTATANAVRVGQHLTERRAPRLAGCPPGQASRGSRARPGGSRTPSGGGCKTPPSGQRRVAARAVRSEDNGAGTAETVLGSGEVSVAEAVLRRTLCARWWHPGWRSLTTRDGGGAFGPT